MESPAFCGGKARREAEGEHVTVGQSLVRTNGLSRSLSHLLHFCNTQLCLCVFLSVSMRHPCSIRCCLKAADGREGQRIRCSFPVSLSSPLLLFSSHFALLTSHFSLLTSHFSSLLTSLLFSSSPLLSPFFFSTRLLLSSPLLSSPLLSSLPTLL